MTHVTLITSRDVRRRRRRAERRDITGREGLAPPSTELFLEIPKLIVRVYQL
jgi:hypothetical protein